MINELAVAVFKSAFKADLVHFQAFTSFALVSYWIFQLKNEIVEKVKINRNDFIWLIASALTGLIYSIYAFIDWGAEYFLLAIALGLSMAMAFFHSTVAISFLISLLFLRPWELIEKNDFFQLLPKLLFTLCIGHIGIILAKERKLKPIWSITASLVLLFAMWAFMTTFKAPNPVLAQFKFSETLLKSVFLFFATLNILRNKRDIYLVLGTLVITFFGVGLISIIQTLGVQMANPQSELRLLGIGAFANANDIAALMVLIFPFALVMMFNKQEPLALRGAAVAVVLLSTLSIYLSQSRGAMLSLGVAIALYVVLKLKNKKLTIVFALLAALSVPALIVLSSSQRDSNDLAASSSSRLTFIKTGIVMGVKNPVFGVGYESYPENFERYATEIMHEWGERTAHNSWILAFSELGLLGLILFTLIFYTSLKASIRIYPKHPEFLISLAGYGAAMSFLSHTYLLYPYLLFALIGVADEVA